jgi:hypothetical protein
MPKILKILNEILSEAKRYKFSPEVRERLITLVEKLWKERKTPYKGKTEVDRIPFKLASGVDGLVRVVVNPRLKYIGYMGQKPSKSLDPTDLFVEVNPKFYESKKNLYLTLYHELLHASDPTQSYMWKPSYDLTYDQENDEKYWGHPIEFFAISNEFLEGLVNEFQRRIDRAQKPEQLKFIKKSLDNIIAYFSKNTPLTKQSLNLIQRINDDQIGSGKFGQILANFQTDYPELSDIIPPTYEDEPYYLHYVQMIKKFNPKIWPKFLTMLYNTKLEIENILNEKGD